jgi:hypothetical protein
MRQEKVSPRQFSTMQKIMQSADPRFPATAVHDACNAVGIKPPSYGEHVEIVVVGEDRAERE